MNQVTCNICNQPIGLYETRVVEPPAVNIDSVLEPEEHFHLTCYNSPATPHGFTTGALTIPGEKPLFT